MPSQGLRQTWAATGKQKTTTHKQATSSNDHQQATHSISQ